MANGDDQREVLQKAPRDYRYRAFVSYSRADLKIVDDVYALLQKFRTPRRLMTETGDFGPPPRSLKLFLDRKSAQLGTTVGDRLNLAISDSAFLIVFCSAASKRSSWVAQEIEGFLAVSRPERVLPVLMRTNLTQPIEDVIPDPLLALGSRMPLGADLLLDGGIQPVAHKLLGGMLGFAQDWVAREQDRDDRRRRGLERGALATVALLASAAAIAGWRAAGESKRAADSFAVSFESLKATTPFMIDLLESGRVRTSDLDQYGENLGEVLKQVDDARLRNLPDVQFAFGQVLTGLAQFSEATGDGATRTTSANRAHRLLDAFRYDIGPNPQLAFCDSALEAAGARSAQGNFKSAIAAAKDCGFAAEDELAQQRDDAEAVKSLTELRVVALRHQALIHFAQRSYAEALRDLDQAYDPELLRDLPGADSGLSKLFPKEAARLMEARGAVLEAMGRYDEAAEAYAGALAQQQTNGASLYEIMGAQSGLARNEGLVGDETGLAIARLDPLIAQFESDLRSDPGLRSLSAALANLMMTRAMILANAPRAEDSDIVSRAIADFEQAGGILAGLRRFDNRNRIWRLQEADLRAEYGEFLFRLAEGGAGASQACGGDCFARSRAELEKAVAILSDFDVKSHDILFQLCSVHLRLARTVRESGTAGAGLYLDQATAYLGPLKVRAAGDRGVAVAEASLADERADNLLADGKLDLALASYNEARAIQDALAEAEPNWTSIRRDALWSRLKIAEALATGSDRAALRAAFSDACRAAREAGVAEAHLMHRTVREIRESAARAGLACPS